MSIFQKKIFGFSDEAFGLDLSDNSVKVVKIVNEGNLHRVESFGEALIPPGSMSEGEVVDKSKVIGGIKKALASAKPKKIKTNRVVCSLPETKAFLRIISIPKMKEEEIAEAIKWEIEANIPLSIDQVYYDWQHLPVNIALEKGKISILVVAVAKNIVDKFIETLEESGLMVTGIEIESIAQSRSLVRQEDQNKTSLIIDLGSRRTSLFISIGNVPCFTSSIPISVSSFKSEFSKTFKVSQEEAEKISLTYGVGSIMKKDLVYQSVKPVIEGIAAEVIRSIDFYTTSLKYSDSIDSVILCGGGSNIKGIVPFLSRAISQKIVLGDPWVNLKLGRYLPIIDRKKSAKYSTAIGLALKGLENI